MRATIYAPRGAEERGDSTVSPLPHHITQCQFCGMWIDGWRGPIVALLNHVADAHPCTCKTVTVRRMGGGRGHFETHTLTLVCETHRAVRCPELGGDNA